jgi:hypothetical protein
MWNPIAIRLEGVKINKLTQLSGFLKPALSAGGSHHTQFRLSAPKARCGRPGNSLSLKQSGPFILRRA